MIKSMTGFGRCEYSGDALKANVEIKSVNHKYLDLFIRIPKQLSQLEDRIRKSIGDCISRGKVDVYIGYENLDKECKNVVIDENLAGNYIKSLDYLKNKYGIDDTISLSVVAQLPDVIKVEKNEQDLEIVWKELSSVVNEALDNLVKMRANEGVNLKNCIIEHINYMEEQYKLLCARAPVVISIYKSKLEKRLKELLKTVDIDESRLAMEVAIFADRSNIDEEIGRLHSHMKQIRETLEMNQPIGRKLDFIVQEINREVNTIGSKANDLTITKIVLEIKNEPEKIREQSQNIE